MWNVPLARSPQTLVSVAAATDGSAASLIKPIRRAIATVSPASAVHWTSTMEDEVALEVRARTLSMASSLPRFRAVPCC